MKILLIGNYPHDRQESMQRVASLIAQSLKSINVDAELMIPTVLVGKLRASGTGLGKWLGYVDKFLIFPRHLKRRVREWRAQGEQSIVIHICDHSNAFYTRYLKDVPKVVTCHDLLAVRSALGEVPENPTKWSGRRLQSMILGGLNKADHVACISSATRDDLLRLTTLRKDQVSLIPNAFNYPYAPMPRLESKESIKRLLERNGLASSAADRGFILHVGGNQWYKNRMGVLRIYSHLVQQTDGRAPALIMAGKAFTPEMQAFIVTHDLISHVFPITGCDNEELRALYSEADALLFPSLAEGFGWPIIEAQACECPVVCSSGEPFLEASGGAALMRDPKDEEGFAGDFAQLQKPGERDRLIRLGLENARRYAPAAMAKDYRRLYSELLMQ